MKIRKFNFSIVKFSNIAITALILFILACMIISPAKFIGKSLEGISAWAFNVLPSVLPFMFFTRVLSSLGTLDKLTRPLAPISSALFKTPPISIYTFVMAILSGYPVGSKMVADLYMQGKISKQDAFKMTAFCSTSGPMFIVGAVGVGMFHNSKLGYILFISHVLGAILNGILYRNLKGKQTQNSVDLSTNTLQENTSPIAQKDSNTAGKQPVNISDIVLNSTMSILSVGCIITIFFIVIECFSPIFSLLQQNLAFFFEGCIEITKGCIDIATLSNPLIAATLCSFVISFGGISTILQSITMLNAVKMPVKLFALQKFTHAVFSTAITLVVMLIF